MPSSHASSHTRFVGNDRVLFGIIFGVLAFWLFAQTTLNISSVMADDLGIETSVMNIAVSITALFSGIFIVVVGSLADRFGRVKMVRIGFVLSIAGSLLVGAAPSGTLAPVFLMPELSIDPVVAGSSLVMALQTIVSRNVSPHNSAVVTVGAFQSGNAGNVIAQSAILRLSIRTKTPEDRKLVLGKVRDLTRAQAEGYGCTQEIREGVPGAVLVNDEAETLCAADIARAAFGDDDVVFPGPTFLGSEDFAFMLQEKKGTYCFIGNGDTPMVHHPQFVLDQNILPRGAAYWVALAEGYLR